ncbi:hypothetical protein BDR05DRAFT_1006198 [Suillus weaverae]|nr:hypothetical protein BDR05DRAFT_1006198 [Suillus weaverae]
MSELIPSTKPLRTFEDHQRAVNAVAVFPISVEWVLILSPNSHRLAYTTSTKNDYKIYVCDTPPDVLAQASRALSDLLKSDVTSLPAAERRTPPIPVITMVQRPPLTIEPQQPIFVRLRKLLRVSPRMNPLHPVRND